MVHKSGSALGYMAAHVGKASQNGEEEIGQSQEGEMVELEEQSL